MQRVELVGNVGGREQAKVLRQRRQRCRGGEKVEVAVVVLRLAALADTPGERHLIFVANVLRQSHQAGRGWPVPEVLVALGTAQHGFGRRHAALDVPGEKPELHPLAGAGIRLSTWIEWATQHICLLCHESHSGCKSSPAFASGPSWTAGAL